MLLHNPDVNRCGVKVTTRRAKVDVDVGYEFLKPLTQFSEQ